MTIQVLPRMHVRCVSNVSNCGANDYSRTIQINLDSRRRGLPCGKIAWLRVCLVPAQILASEQVFTRGN